MQAHFILCTAINKFSIDIKARCMRDVHNSHGNTDSVNKPTRYSIYSLPSVPLCSVKPLSFSGRLQTLH